ncbi:MAG TPA: hypothetical protein PKC67_05040 [Kiritimatiellia bacterium]|nr:hypothetical protein [Kiritimatiellia bacterium]HMP33698.1 hypothetical protein [Kiritimatiellia bacterium]
MNMVRFVWAMAVFVGVGVAQAQTPQDDWTDVTRDEVDTALLSPMGHRLLDDPRFKWLHAHTEHFVIHYERKMFAAKVARQAEFFYGFIAKDLTSATDQMNGRSHIFIFRDEKDWKHFIQTYEVSIEWAFSMVNGMVMYLQQADSTGDSASVLGHEMTHLVFNRFYPGRIPVWLNEGTAEWYGEFAYSAFKGIKKSKRQVFRRIPTVYPVESLLGMTTYPADPRAVRAFYDTSKFLVGFLQLNYPPEKFEPFLADMSKGMPVEPALAQHYGVASLSEFAKAFEKFVR